MSQREQVEIELLRKQLADAGDGVFTAADEAKLDGIEAGATADQAWGDIGGTLSSQTDLQSALDAKQVDLDVVSQAEAEAGTATTERIWTAERVAQAIAALESGGGGGGGGSGAWEVIEVIDASAASAVDFTSIPATYGALKLVYEAEGSGSAGQSFLIRANGDSGANYTRAIVYQSSSTPSAYAGTGETSWNQWLGDIISVGEYVWPNYANTSRPKAMSCHVFNEYTSGGVVPQSRILGGSWDNTAAINQLTLTCGTGTVTGKFILLGLNETPGGSGDSKVMVPITDLPITYTGAPGAAQILSTTYNVIYRAFDASSFEALIGTVDIPPGWSTADIYLWTINHAGGAANDVVAQVYIRGFDDGDTADAATVSVGTGNVVCSISGTQYTVERHALGTLDITDVGQLCTLILYRAGSNGSDTFASDIGYVGVELVKAT